ncbi:MAG: AraC family transcriptional regulator [Planctomycetota bacterium]
MHKDHSELEGRLWILDGHPAGSTVWVFKTNRVRCECNYVSQQFPSGITLRIITHGQGFVSSKEQSWAVGVGDLFIAVPGQEITFGNTPESSWEWHELQLIGEGAMPLLQSCGCTPQHPASTARSPEQAIQAFADLHTLFATEGRRPHQALSLLHTIVDACGQQTYPSPHGERGRSHLVRRAQSLIESQLDLQQNVTEIARALKVDRTTLGRAFLQETGASPLHYLKTRRLARAKELLSTTDLPVKAIARSVGYSSTKYFIRCFRESTGKTPTQWRPQKG